MKKSPSDYQYWAIVALLAKEARSSRKSDQESDL